MRLDVLWFLNTLDAVWTGGLISMNLTVDVVNRQNGNRALMQDSERNSQTFRLRIGDIVEVRSREEILATLDERGSLAGLPFMPEMLQYCGSKFEVWKRADKTCDETAGGAIRKVENTVHLKETRCDGSLHGGCQAGCLLFWHEQWLRKASRPQEGASPRASVAKERLDILDTSEANRRVGILIRSTRTAQSGRPGTPEETFSCQLTETSRFSKHLPWWDVRQYFRDLISGNVTVPEFAGGIFAGTFNKIQDFRKRAGFRIVAGTKKSTPVDNLDLKPGDLVQTKTQEEIAETLDRHGKNRGLAFRPELVRHCGGRFQVLRRLEKIIDPKTSKMLPMGGRCVILEGAVCGGQLRRFCPRMNYTYWRDIWLKKVSFAPEQGAGDPPIPVAETKNRNAGAIGGPMQEGGR
jgi:hypothetical protein